MVSLVDWPGSVAGGPSGRSVASVPSVPTRRALEGRPLRNTLNTFSFRRVPFYPDFSFLCVLTPNSER